MTELEPEAVARLVRGGALAVARRLLGARLVHESHEGRTVGRIVETEAYLADDAASHSFRGPTGRNRAMFLGAGHAYVYRIYGLHLCLNVVTGRAGHGEAVLLRALEPLEGIELMAARRGTDRLRDLCSGPAKLAQAMGVRPEHDGADLAHGRLRLIPESGGTRPEVAVTPRIGITRAADRPLRFLVAGSPWLSRPGAPREARLDPPRA